MIGDKDRARAHLISKNSLISVSNLSRSYAEIPPTTAVYGRPPPGREVDAPRNSSGCSVAAFRNELDRSEIWPNVFRIDEPSG